MNGMAITGVVLAGGLGRRMGGADKGLLIHRGRPLALQAAQRLAPQVASVLLSANRNQEAYRAFGFPVLGDLTADFAGPLAGLLVALKVSEHPLVVTVPCDTPEFPTDLVQRLASTLLAADAEVAVARAQGRIHAAFCLCRRELAENLADFLASGERRVLDWQARHRQVLVDFPDASAFANLNTPTDIV